MSTVTERPPEFDARVMQYLPGLRKLARKFTRSTEERDDLVTDTIAKALEDWQKFREDGGFWNWLYWTMRSLVSHRVQYDRAAIRHGVSVQMDIHVRVGTNDIDGDEDDDDDPFVHARFFASPVQAVRLHLEDTIRIVADIRHGDVLMRVAHGDTLRAIAAERGVSPQRIQQMVAAARSELEDRS